MMLIRPSDVADLAAWDLPVPMMDKGSLRYRYSAELISSGSLYSHNAEVRSSDVSLHIIWLSWESIEPRLTQRGLRWSPPNQPLGVVA